jgi:hypothetical protein
MDSIVRTVDKHEFGLQRRSIFGLNILGVNRVKTEAENDPRIIFLRSLSEKYPCSAHTGNLYDLAENPQELFGPHDGENPYVQVRIGVYSGNFYDVEDWPVFPRVSSRRPQAAFGEQGQETVARICERRSIGERRLCTSAPMSAH